LRNVTITLEESVARWARIEAAQQDTSVSALIAALMREKMSERKVDPAVAEAAKRLATFGKRHGLSAKGLNIKEMINEGRR
jgi:hypothetical protein